MKVLVAYTSVTGNTRKVAEAIYGEIRTEKDLKEIKDLEGLKDHDLYFVGFPIQAYGPGQEERDFLEKHAAGKDIALFVTHATPEEGEPLLAQWLEACRAAAAGANIVDMFNCQGELAENIAEFMKNSGDPQLSAWAEDRPDTIGQPDAARLDRARAFARRVMERYGT